MSRTLALIALLLAGCTSAPDLDPEYATAAFCAREPVKGGDAQLIQSWGEAHHIDCSGVN